MDIATMKELFGPMPMNQLSNAQIIANRQATLNLILVLGISVGILTIYAIKLQRENTEFKRWKEEVE